MNANEEIIIKSQIANLGFPDFCKFVMGLLKTHYENDIEIYPYSKIGQDVFLRYNGDYESVYFLDQIPLGLFKNPDEIIVDNPYTRKKMQIINEDFKDKYGVHGGCSKQSY